MALLLTDGCNLYASAPDALTVKGITYLMSGFPTSFAQPGRLSTQRSVLAAQWHFVTPVSGDTVIVQVSQMGLNSLHPPNGVYVQNGSGAGSSGTFGYASDQFMLLPASGATPASTWQVMQGGTVLWTSPAGFTNTQWYNCALKVKFGTAGTARAVLQIDGSTYYDSGATLTTSAPASTALVGLDGAQVTYYTDLIVMDGSGTEFNDFLGDVRVESLLPNGDGTHTDWTPSSGTTHYNLVNDFAADDSNYVSSVTVSNVDTYTLADLASPSTYSVLGVRPVVVARKTSAAIVGVAPVIRSSATDYVDSSSDLPPALTYEQLTSTHSTDPATSAAWTRTAVNAVEVGEKLTA